MTGSDTSPEARRAFLDRLRDPEPRRDGEEISTRLARADEAVDRLQAELSEASAALSHAISQAAPGARGVTMEDAIESAEAQAATRTQSPAERHRLSEMWDLQADWQRARDAYDAAAAHRNRLLAEYDDLMAEIRRPAGWTGAVRDVIGVDYGEGFIDRPWHGR